LKLRPGAPLHVSLVYAPDDIVPVGRLAVDGGTALFEYDEAFVRNGVGFNPGWAMPERGLIAAKNPRTFKGLHGVFADSLPDAWGLELMRRRLAERGVSYDTLNALDRLALVGSTGIGALVYRPDFAELRKGEIDLDALAKETMELDGTATDVIEELAALGGSSGGARPKIFIARNEAGKTISGTADIPNDYDAYIVKFRGSTDVADIGPLETAYADMARAASIDVSPTMLIPANKGKGPGYFATRRFDRLTDNRRIHVLSIAAILEVDWSQPTIDYSQLIAVVHRITRDYGAAEQMFRRMVFNVLAANADDHAKQHSLLQLRTGRWTLAPAYDLTLSSGPNGERYLAVNNKGKNITLEDIYSVAREASIKGARARVIVDDVRAAIANFPKFAADYGVTRATIASFKRETGAFTKVRS
jgi:serine/threonine-protein kinase HipA